MSDGQDKRRALRLQGSAADRESWPKSPCVSICTLDDGNMCLGCGRSLEQISRWAVLKKDEQWAIVDELARRAADK